MNGIYSWALSFTVCSFIVLIINYLFPKGNVKNTETTVLVLFCIVSLIKPIREIKMLSPFKTEYTEIETNQFTDGTVAAFKTQIRQLTDKALKEIGINDYEMTVDVSVTENEIVVEKFDVYIENTELKEKAKEIITEKTGVEPNVFTFE